MTKIFVKNRKGQNICVAVEENAKQKGLVFIMHGLGGFKEQPHLQTIAEAFKENNYMVVLFDTTNSIGESEGKMEDATLTNYYEDLEDIVKWSKDQNWYQESFVLVGHSLGGFSVAYFAQNYPNKVKAIAPISTVVSGKLLEESPDFKEIKDNWEKNKIREWASSSQPGLIKKLKWSHVEDRRKYDLLPEVKKLIMPVLMMVGELDDTTPIVHQKILFDLLPTKRKEMHIIKGAEHTFKKPEHLIEIGNIFYNWIKKI